MPVSTYYWNNLSMDFVTGLPILTDWKEDSFNSIFVIIDWFIKKVYYKPVKVTINSLGLAEVIISVVVRYHSLSNSIVTNWGLLFTSKFWSSLYYFLVIKWRLFTAFYPQIDDQTEWQNSILEACLWDFVKFKPRFDTVSINGLICLKKCQEC